MPASSAADSVSIPAVSARELITVCRQIAGMMEAEVDILRITRVLRAQTENARLLEWYDELDHELTMGRAVSDAMARAPELFSAFAVSLVRQGEERNAVAHAFGRLADFLQQENATPAALKPAANVSATASQTAPISHVSAPTTAGISSNTDWNVLLEKSSVLGAGVLGALAVAESLVLVGWLPARWGRVAARVGGALVLGALATMQRNAVSPRVASEEFVLPTSQSESFAPVAAPDIAPRWDEVEPEAPEAEVSLPRAFGGWMAEETPRAATRRPRDEEEFD